MRDRRRTGRFGECAIDSGVGTWFGEVPRLSAHTGRMNNEKGTKYDDDGVRAVVRR